MSETRRLLSLAVIDIDESGLEQKEFQVLKVGEYYDRRYGKFKITGDLLQRLKDNFDKDVLGIDVALDVNHDANQGAKAWISSLSVRDDALYATFKDFTEEAQRFFREKIYKYFSVEFAPFTKVENGKKVTIKDVLRGIALTNRPVIKNMQPTFLSEAINNSLETSDMSVISIFSDELLKRDKITGEDVSTLKAMFASLSEEEQAEAQEKVEEVEAKAEEQAEAEAEKEEGAEAEDAEGAEGEESEGEEASEEPAEAAAAELAELREKSKKDAARLSELEAREAERTLSERVESLTLSAENLTGFSSEKEEEVSEFVKTLSDEQFAAFSEIVSAVQTIDESMLSEIGSGQAGESKDEDAKLSEVAELAEKYEKDGLEKHLAIEKAQKEVFSK